MRFFKCLAAYERATRVLKHNTRAPGPAHGQTPKVGDVGRIADVMVPIQSDSGTSYENRHMAIINLLAMHSCHLAIQTPQTATGFDSKLILSLRLTVNDSCVTRPCVNQLP
jgi:hypothetical protein